MKGETIHVYPVNDLKSHNTDSLYCNCKPRVDEIPEGRVVIHNAWDGREFFEDEAAFDEVNQ